MQTNTLDYDRQKFGKAVRRYRGTIKGDDFAGQVGISRAVLARVEHGKVVDDWIIRKLCDRMEVDLADFPSGRAGDPNRPNS